MKNKILKVFLLDLSYFLLLLFTLIFSRLKIGEILLKIQSYGPQLNSVNVTQNTLEAQNLLTQINGLTNNAYFIIFLAIPLIAFILYAILQGYSFYLLKKENNYFFKFSLASLPSVILITLLIFYPDIYLFILLILIMYISFFLYFKNLNKIRLIYTKIYKLFPLFLLYLLLSLIIISIFFIAYLNLISNGSYILFIVGLIVTLIFSYYKTILVEKLFN
ncbi:MAG: hypothetical protein AABW45_01295 [Nanoarchaeota archaeon]